MRTCDEVLFMCPVCHHNTRLMTDSGDRDGKVYGSYSVPLSVAHALEEKRIQCTVCAKISRVVIVTAPPTRVEMLLVETTE